MVVSEPALPAAARAPMVALPAQPDGVPWPALSWPEGPLPEGVIVDDLMEVAFDPEGPVQTTYATVLIHRGRLVYERYGGALPRFDGPGRVVDEETPLLSWSMAKSMLHVALGMLVAEGRLDPAAPAPVPLWSSPGDARAAITLEDLLTMRDGLDFLEDYEDMEGSDVVQMLFGRGQADMAAFAADRPLLAPPGTRYNYSSGTANIISGIVAHLVGPGEPYRDWLDERLFGLLGMSSATPGFDDAGTWTASSYLYATARDYARFGLFALRDGVWNDRHLLPEGWIDHGRRPRSVDPDDGTLYGAQWWTVPSDTGVFWANGHEGQRIKLFPTLDLVLVRLGRSESASATTLDAWCGEVADRFR